MMKREFLKTVLYHITVYAYVLLYSYAALVKLLDYEHFTTQLGQSPMLATFAESLALGVPILEIVVALMLVIPKTRLIGLYLATGLMAMFCVYIYAILHFGTFVPCSCGGILETMSWKEHLVFNLIFLALGIAASYFGPSSKSKLYRTKLLGFTLFASTAIISALLYRAEQITQHANSFIRRTSGYGALPVRSFDLHYSSDYIAGTYRDSIYLGNTMARLVVMAVDTALKTNREHRIVLADTTLPFRGVAIRVAENVYYAYDGSIPAVFSGALGSWKAKRIAGGNKFFTLASPMGDHRLAVRSQRGVTGESVLAIVNCTSGVTNLNSSLLQKQADGVLDTDGVLLYSPKQKKVVYLYTYRNQYIIADENLELVARGNTIDTISKPDLQIKSIKGGSKVTFAKKPLATNKTAAVFNNLLFVRSGVPGKHENLEMWKRASTIDVYDIARQRYLMSFYVDDVDGKKVRQFVVDGNKMYALQGKYLTSYSLTEEVTRYYEAINAKQ